MAMYTALKKYKPRKPVKNLLPNAKYFYDGREMISNAFRNKIFPLSIEEFFERADRDKFKYEDKFHTSRNLKTIPELSNFENEEIDITDMPDLEGLNKGKRIKNINSTTNA